MTLLCPLTLSSRTFLSPLPPSLHSPSSWSLFMQIAVLLHSPSLAPGYLPTWVSYTSSPWCNLEPSALLPLRSTSILHSRLPCSLLGSQQYLGSKSTAWTNLLSLSSITVEWFSFSANRKNSKQGWVLGTNWTFHADWHHPTHLSLGLDGHPCYMPQHYTVPNCSATIFEWLIRPKGSDKS